MDLLDKLHGLIMMSKECQGHRLKVMFQEADISKFMENTILAQLSDRGWFDDAY